MRGRQPKKKINAAGDPTVSSRQLEPGRSSSSICGGALGVTPRLVVTAHDNSKTRYNTLVKSPSLSSEYVWGLNLR